VADGWCWFVLREEYCWLVAGGWFVVREKYCWLVADKPSEQGARQFLIEMTVDDPVLIIPCSDSSSVLICMRPQQMRTPMFADRLAGSSLKMSASTLSQEL
jgi:hypothetical protein